MRFNTISVSLKKSCQEELPVFLQNYYNKSVHTNKTIKLPFSCAANHKTCNCHRNSKGQNKEKARNFAEHLCS